MLWRAVAVLSFSWWLEALTCKPRWYQCFCLLCINECPWVTKLNYKSLLLYKAVASFFTLIQISFKLLFLCLLSEDLGVSHGWETKELQKIYRSCTEMFKVCFVYVCESKKSKRIYCLCNFSETACNIQRNIYSFVFFHLNYIHQRKN